MHFSGYKGLLLALLICFGPALGLAQEQKQFVCEQKYALCTSAPCIPDPSQADQAAVCRCMVHEGKSFGHKTCEARAPKKLADGTEILVSNYAFAEYELSKTMLCPAGSPWSFCLDMPCTVDPMDPKKAICTCEIKREGAYITLGGNCDTGSCKNAYWSGATLSDVNGASNFLAKEMGLAAPPKNDCP